MYKIISLSMKKISETIFSKTYKKDLSKNFFY